MPDRPLAEWQARFFEQRVCTPVSGPEGVYFREQIFGALAVLEEALPEVLESLGEQNFRFFVRELLDATQPNDALGTTLIPRFTELLETHPKLAP